MTPIPIWQAGGTIVGVTSTCNSELNTQYDLKQFRLWALRHGFILKRMYRSESSRRAYTLTGTGVYAGLLFQVINRVTLSQDHPSRFGKTYRRPVYDYTKLHRPRIGEVWDGRHRRTDCNIMTDCSIAGFFDNMNLLGYYGLTYNEVMNTPAEKIRQILSQGPRYRYPR